MIGLYRDPEGKNVFGKDSLQSTQGADRLTSQIDRSRVVYLEKEIQSLQTRLKVQQTLHDCGPQVRECVVKNIAISDVLYGTIV